MFSVSGLACTDTIAIRIYPVASSVSSAIPSCRLNSTKSGGERSTVLLDGTADKRRRLPLADMPAPGPAPSGIGNGCSGARLE
ncbi:hypothetical protein GCM10017774_43480 [Lentzea cavernae]|uniref:Uncharacterized protein n=1 Tax=Lentzea cavernae TaxID=2020703 RepID=A0ABQ3MMQ8_9PSEU|nr:hypothetical protein GCM10017774_43480 [Lentzea cavernae]